MDAITDLGNKVERMAQVIGAQSMQRTVLKWAYENMAALPMEQRLSLIERMEAHVSSVSAAGVQP